MFAPPGRRRTLKRTPPTSLSTELPSRSNSGMRGEPRQQGRPLDSLLIVVPGVIWGASFLFIAEGLQAVAPMGVTVVRIALGFAALSFVPAARRPILREDRVKTVALGVLWLAFPLSMFPFAEQHVSSALAGMLNGATPIFAALVASLLARQAPARRVGVGLAVGFAGAVLMALPGLSGLDAMRGQAPGVLMILAALVSYAFAYSLARPLQQRNGSLPVVWRALGWAFVLTLPLGKHTSELQSLRHLVCRLLLETKKRPTSPRRKRRSQPMADDTHADRAGSPGQGRRTRRGTHKDQEKSHSSW